MSWSTGGPCPRQFIAEIEGHIFRASSHLQIFTLYSAWKKNRNERLPLDWEETVWLALKKSHPKHFHRVHKKASPGVSVASASSFLTYLIKRARGKKLVEPEEAKRRAAICFSCPMKQPVLGCTVCKQALKMFVKPPETVQTPEACGACGCWLPAKVWINRAHLGSSEEFNYWKGDETRPACWMMRPAE